MFHFGCKFFLNFRRLGLSDKSEVKSAEEEVNEYLIKAIDARSIDRLRTDHCKKICLTFKKEEIEKKYCTEPDPMLKIYFYCSMILYFGIMSIQILIFPRWVRGSEDDDVLSFENLYPFSSTPT